MHCWHCVLECQSGKLLCSAIENNVGGNYERASLQLNQLCKGGVEITLGTGFEDVELCLRLAYRLRKAVVCRNDCVALHHHGHTRLSGRELSIFSRLMRNSAVLQGHIGLWIKQAYWRSLLQRDGHISSEPLTIGIVVDGDPAGVDTPLVQAAVAMARQLSSALPHAEIVLLNPAGDWKSVAGLHMLVVGDPRYDIRSLKGARADLLTIAWLREDAKLWPQLPWWRQFGSCVTPAGPAARIAAAAVGRHVNRSRPAQPLGELLSPGRWRLRVAIHLPCRTAEFGVASPIVREAEALRDSLQRADLPCWLVGAEEWNDHPVMADVCITLWGLEHPKGLRPPLRTDTLNVLWMIDPKAKVRPKWRDAGCLVRRSMPKAQWLEEEMEKRVGSTFSPP